MPRKKVIGKCRECGEEKPLFDVKNNLCGSCAGKRGGGRPKALNPKKKPAAVSSGNIPPADSSPAKSGTSNSAGSSAGTNSGEKYLCEACGKELRYGQRKCSCGVWADWRGTAVEQDEDLVLCPECGAICGHVGTAEVCPHCNFSG